MNGQVRAYVLAGGESRRFPGDKARAVVEGQPQILRLNRQLMEAGHQVHFVADRTDRYADLGLECIVDQHPGSGPLGGLITALSHHQVSVGDGWILLVGCDQLVWRSAWSYCEDELDRMANSVSSLVWKAELFSPVPGYFHTSALASLRILWDSGARALRSLQDHADLQPGSLRTQPMHPSCYSFNTPEQLHHFLQNQLYV
ncbi:MAG: NTP transferase domain-containing protein [Pirellulales bacterium]